MAQAKVSLNSNLFISYLMHTYCIREVHKEQKSNFFLPFESIYSTNKSTKIYSRSYLLNLRRPRSRTRVDKNSTKMTENNIWPLLVYAIPAWTTVVLPFVWFSKHIKSVSVVEYFLLDFSVWTIVEALQSLQRTFLESSFHDTNIGWKIFLKYKILKIVGSQISNFL